MELSGSMPQKAPGSSLQHCKVCSTQHSLGIVERINFAAACLLPYFVVLQQPITLGVQRRDVSRKGHHFVARRRLGLFQRYKLAFCVSERRNFSRQRLRVCSPFCRRLSHHSHVVCLCVLFLGLCLCHFLREISDEQIDHCNHA